MSNLEHDKFVRLMAEISDLEEQIEKLNKKDGFREQYKNY